MDNKGNLKFPSFDQFFEKMSCPLFGVPTVLEFGTYFQTSLNFPRTSYRSSEQLLISTKTKDLPKSAVIDLYRKYYLDFIVFGFSAESVEEVINGAIGPEFETRKENLKRAKDSLVSKAKEISEKSLSEFENCY